MAESTAAQAASYPLPVYNFQVTVGGTAMSFCEVSGISVEYEDVVYRHGLSFWEGESIKTFSSDKFVPITLKRGTIPGSRALYLYDWLKKRESRSLEISLCDARGIPVMAWKIAKAVPVKLAAPAFDAGTNEVSIESLELKARGVSLVER